MDSESTDPNLMLLSLNLSDSEPEEAAAPGNTTPTTTTAPTAEYQPTRAERTALSEEAFQALKQTYRPKVENGDIRSTIPLPLPTTTPLPKPQAQALLHAAEELYFFRRYAEAAAFVRQVLGEGGDEDGEGGGENGDGNGEGKGEGEGGGGGEGGSKGKVKTRTTRKGRGRGVIDGETRRLLAYYLERCEARARDGGGGGNVGVSVS